MGEVSNEGRPLPDYGSVLKDVTGLILSAKQVAIKQINSSMTALYWMVGRRIVRFEQLGESRAEYGKRLLERLSHDLTQRFGRGYSTRNLLLMRKFYLAWPVHGENPQAIGGKGAYKIPQTLSAEFNVTEKCPSFPLPWSAYVKLLSVHPLQARLFYEAEAIRGGWSVRQLGRQIDAQFFERTALSKNKEAMLESGREGLADLPARPETEIKDPFVLEFLGLKDEYSESDFEETLIESLEAFLLELGRNFCFVGRQKRLRIGDSWYRVDLIFFHRKLRCLVIVDLKIGSFSHADAGQMHLYLNYAKQHWTNDFENPPVGLILCAAKNSDVVHYALDGLPNQVLAREYRIALPKEEELIAEIARVRAELDNRL